ncbi:hypothetical protein AADZ86_18175 [Colwelliaceae bacterium BS250]
MGKQSSLIKQMFSIGIICFVFSSPYYAKASQYDIHDAQQKISLQFDATITTAHKDILQQWVIHSSDALKTVYGEFPVDHFITKIKASNSNSGVVPWGEVSRDTPPEVLLVVNVNSNLVELKNDWTIYHEFSHLLIPYDGGNSRWLSEGLASYYQNVLQARSGMFSEQKMWQKLYDGFERGRKQTNYNHQTLSYVSEHMRDNNNYMRVYWSGALFWLKADVELRKLNNGYSLDKALLQLRQCCFSKSLSATEIIIQLDSLSKSKVFSSLHQTFANSFTIPNFQHTLSELGISQQAGKITLSPDGQLVQLRENMFLGGLVTAK